MSEGHAEPRRLRFSLRHLFVATAVAALLAALLTRSWHSTQTRLEYCAKAGAVHGHVRTMQGYSCRVNRSTISGLFFGDMKVDWIHLYPGTYDQTDLVYIRALFPEANITDYDSSD